MSYMFNGSSFNGNISGWNVSNVIDFYNIFNDAYIYDDYKPYKFLNE